MASRTGLLRRFRDAGETVILAADPMITSRLVILHCGYLTSTQMGAQSRGGGR
jgi:hypothetical protein